MEKRLLISAVILGILVLAVGGWTVQGLCHALAASRLPAHRRSR